jgi:hypothetical protein
LNHGRVRWIVCPLLCAVTAGVFWPVVRCDFIDLDDAAYVTANDVVKDGLTCRGLSWALRSTHASNWHPVTWVSHMVDVQLFGLNPSSHHFMNLMFHITNSALLFMLLEFITGAVWRSAFVAAVFALHPLRVESVAWISERKDVLSGLLFLLTLGAYSRYVLESQADGPRRAFFYRLTIVLLALGLASKPMLVTVPFVLLLLDYWPFRRLCAADRGERPSPLQLKDAIREKLPLLAMSVVSCVVTVVAQSMESLEHLPLWARFANATISYMRYVAKTVWPSGLVVYYPRLQGPVLLVAIASAIGLTALTSMAVSSRRKAAYLAVGWLWFMGMLVPVIGIVQVGHQAMADRYTYLPTIGLVVALTWGLSELARTRTWTSILATSGVVVVCTLALMTRAQLAHWTNSRSLFAHALAQDPANPVIHNYVANGLVRAGRLAEALNHYEQAVRSDPQYLEAYNNWGFTLATMGRPQEAIAKYEKALAINPNDMRVRNNLEQAYSATKRLER